VSPTRLLSVSRCHLRWCGVTLSVLLGNLASGQDESNSRLAEGAVRDSTAHMPVATAAVSISREGYTLCRTATNGSGRFACRIQDRGPYRVDIHRQGFMPWTTNVVAFDRQLDALLEPAGTLTGRLVAARNTPISYSHVLLVTSDQLFAGRVGLSDASGHFRIDGLIPSPSAVFVQHVDFAPILGLPIDLSRGDLPPIELELSAGTIVRGRLLTEPPSAIGQVAIVGEGDRSFSEPVIAFLSVAAKADGTFALRAPHRTTLALRLSASPGQSVPRTITIRTGEKRTLDLGALRLEVGGSVFGVITDLRGSAVGTASLQLVPAGGQSSHGVSLARSRDDGSFEMKRIQPGRYRLTAEAQGYESWSDDIVVAPGQPIQTDIVLRRSSSLSGAVVDQDDVPVDRYQVRVESSFHLRPVRTVLTNDELGLFKIDGLPEGTYSILISSATSGAARIRDVATVAGGDTSIGTVHLNTEPLLRGLVSDRSGRPVVNAQVLLGRNYHESGGAARDRSVEATTTEEGQFVFKGIEPGSGDLQVSHDHFAPVRIPVEVPAQGGTTVEVVLTRGGGISGTVRSRRGVPRASTRVIASALVGNQTWTQETTVTDAVGRFSIDRLPTGPAMVQVAQVGERASSPGRMVEIRDEATVEVELLSDEIMLRGSIRSRNEPIAGCFLTVRCVTAPEIVARTQANSDGRFTLELSTAGAYEFTPGGGIDCSLPSKRVNVPDEPEYEVLLSYDATAVEGVVSKADGTAFEGAAVVASALDGSNTTYGLTGGGGRYRLALEPGPYSVSARAEGFLGDTKQLIAEPDISIEVDLILRDGGEGIRGRVIDGSGTGVAGVLVVSSASGGSGVVEGTYSGSDGAFHFDRLVGPMHDLLAYQAGQFATLRRMAPGETEVALRLDRGRLLQFQLQGTDSEALKNARISLWDVSGMRIGGLVTLGGSDDNGNTIVIAPVEPATLLVENEQSRGLARLTAQVGPIVSIVPFP
jgi:hypothetical protein